MYVSLKQEEEQMPTTSQTPTTLQEGLAALRQTAAATGELLGSMNEAQNNAPVPRLTWTVAETAAHLVATLRQSAAFASGARNGAAERSPSASAAERVAQGNARELDLFTERRIPVLHELLASAVDEYATVIVKREDQGIETLVGQEAPAAMTAALLGEQLVHGFDLARALGRRWTVDPAAARLMLAGTAEFLPYFVDTEAIRDVRARIEIRIAGNAPFVLILDHGRATVEPADGNCDGWVLAQPVPYLLVGFGRVSRWGPLLRRQIRAGGRRPLVAARMASYLTSI
jgi:uncharacterized protein (TIGR03083 family)